MVQSAGAFGFNVVSEGPNKHGYVCVCMFAYISLHNSFLSLNAALFQRIDVLAKKKKVYAQFNFAFKMPVCVHLFNRYFYFILSVDPPDTAIRATCVIITAEFVCGVDRKKEVQRLTLSPSLTIPPHACHRACS